MTGSATHAPPKPRGFRSWRERAAFFGIVFAALNATGWLLHMGIGVPAFLALNALSGVLFSLGWRLWERRTGRR
ncbi:hypothetical protein [Candidatus Poriferisodalis sp.]|uniref:hypothetical protein n=1 Tax=Candidatus Poriferisodalis sp. TaxID=3101277 RepID=UPI003B01F0EF